MSLRDHPAAPPDQATSARPADVDRRFLALVVDRVVGWGLVAASTWACWRFLVDEGSALLGWTLAAVVAGLVGLGFAVGTGLRGITPGKALLGLRVVKEGSGTPIGVGAAVLRGLILLAATLPLGFGLVMVAWSAVTDSGRQRRGFHDVITGSVVLDVRPEPVEDEAEEDDAPRHVVNLTAMRLRPAPAPTPARRPADDPARQAAVQQNAAAVPPAPGRPAGPQTPAQPQQQPQQPASQPAWQQRPGQQPGQRPAPSQPQRPTQQTYRPPTQQAAPQPPAAPQQAAPQPPATPQQGTPQRPSAPPVAPPAPGGRRRREEPATPSQRPAAPQQRQPAPPSTSPHQVRPAAGPPPSDATRAGGPIRTWRVTFDSGESFVVTGLALVGRKPEARQGENAAHVVPLSSTDMSVSKTHAQLHLSPEGALVVMDRGSTNGSYLHRGGVARELTPGRAATLLDGDLVRFGDREMRVSREG